VIVLEGRDGAGKGGTIKALTERVSPRIFRTVALPAPSSRQQSQMYMQRYVEQFPAAGEIVIFDRSWYNRAGVEHVMGFCSKPQYERFLKLCPVVEQFMVEGGTLEARITHDRHGDQELPVQIAIGGRVVANAGNLAANGLRWFAFRAHPQRPLVMLHILISGALSVNQANRRIRRPITCNSMVWAETCL